MSKKKKTVEPYKDVKELNWGKAPAPHTEQTEPVPCGAGPEVSGKDTDVPARQEDPGTGFTDPGLKMSLASQVVGDVLIQNLMKVDAELRRGNPVWHWCLADDHCTFVFRNGQKVTVTF